MVPLQRRKKRAQRWHKNYFVNASISAPSPIRLSDPLYSHLAASRYNATTSARNGGVRAGFSGKAPGIRFNPLVSPPLAMMAWGSLHTARGDLAALHFFCCFGGRQCLLAVPSQMLDCDAMRCGASSRAWEARCATSLAVARGLTRSRSLPCLCLESSRADSIPFPDALERACVSSL